MHSVMSDYRHGGYFRPTSDCGSHRPTRRFPVHVSYITLETRRLRGDQIEVFKILNGYENTDSNIFFEIKESKITRGHNYTLVKKQSRLDVGKYSFCQRTINVWNKLSTDCVHASSVNMFKNKIDKYLAKANKHRLNLE